jgi:RNA-binding protein YhbY
MENKRDIRLYYYDNGNIIKVGKGKIGIDRHVFDTIEECTDRINLLKTKKYFKDYQYVIVEYKDNISKDMNSRIIQII